jgi:hypothetical protein
MMLVMSLLLAFIPLLGIVWIVVYGSITTVDGLFMSLILLAMSSILGMNAVFELRKKTTASSAGRQGFGSPRSTSSGLVQRGRVESVVFYESNVGEPNKSIVTLANGSISPHLMVFEGDMRNALPAGQKVEITFRRQDGHNVLVNVNYP